MVSGTSLRLYLLVSEGQEIVPDFQSNQVAKITICIYSDTRLVKNFYVFCIQKCLVQTTMGTNYFLDFLPFLTANFGVYELFPPPPADIHFVTFCPMSAQFLLNDCPMSHMFALEITIYSLPNVLNICPTSHMSAQCSQFLPIVVRGQISDFFRNVYIYNFEFPV